MGRLDGKVAIITGGANGMGATEARLFAQEGAKVVIGDIKEEDGRRLEVEINGAGGEVMFFPLDVTKEEDWPRVVDQTVARFGKLNVLVNNAGISQSSFPDHYSTEGWDRLAEVISKGTFLGTKYVVPKMIEAGGGSIVNISSSAALKASAGGHPGYGAAKAAVRLFTKSTAAPPRQGRYTGQFGTPGADAPHDLLRAQPRRACSTGGGLERQDTPGKVRPNRGGGLGRGVPGL